jgi:mRNA-degrading endonuclease RelE of RelBE toxin-antitoxin system
MSRRYALEFAPKALWALRKLDRPVVERIKAATESLREDPRPREREDAHGNARSAADQGRR